MGCAASTPRKSRRVQLELISSGRLQDKYELHKKVLGRGSFAVVKRCKEIETGAIRACKMVSKYSQERPTQTTQSLNDEIQIFRRMGSHPNILQIFDVYETETIVYIVLELAEGGNPNPNPSPSPSAPRPRAGLPRASWARPSTTWAWAPPG